MRSIPSHKVHTYNTIIAHSLGGKSATMELIDLIGLRYPNNEDMSLATWFKGITSLLMLLIYILFYHVVSVFATVFAVTFPDTGTMIKYKCGTFFWDFGLYLMVRIR